MCCVCCAVHIGSNVVQNMFDFDSICYVNAVMSCGIRWQCVTMADLHLVDFIIVMRYSEEFQYNYYMKIKF